MNHNLSFHDFWNSSSSKVSADGVQQMMIDAKGLQMMLEGVPLLGFKKSGNTAATSDSVLLDDVRFEFLTMILIPDRLCPNDEWFFVSTVIVGSCPSSRWPASCAHRLSEVHLGFWRAQHPMTLVFDWMMCLNGGHEIMNQVRACWNGQGGWCAEGDGCNQGADHHVVLAPVWEDCQRRRHVTGWQNFPFKH